MFCSHFGSSCPIAAQQCTLASVMVKRVRDDTAQDLLRKQRARCSLASQQHQEMVKEINKHLGEQPIVVPAVLQALRSGMFLTRDDAFLDEDVFHHGVIRYGDLPKHFCLAFLAEHEFDIEILSRALKVDPVLTLRLLMTACGVSGSWKVASKRKSSLTATLTERAMRLGDRLAAVKQKFHAQKVKAMILNETLPSQEQLWRQIGPYTFKESKDKEGKEGKEFISISHVSGAEVIKLGNITLAPNLPKHTCVSTVWANVVFIGVLLWLGGPLVITRPP